MWLKRLVAAAMIMACVGMNVLVVWGLFFAKNTTAGSDVSLSNTTPVEAPTIELSVNPVAIPAGTTSAISWKTTGSPDVCTASGAWEGPKTQFGAESTGRVKTKGSYAYTLVCKNKGGSAEAKAVLTVNDASTAPVSNTTPSAPKPTVTYCGGRKPCYGPKEIASHGSSGNCWGWNGDRVINITGLDAAYHKSKTGIGTIEVSSICGKDLAAALGGSASAGGQTHDHKSSTKSNADRNEIPYFVGYYDAKK